MNERVSECSAQNIQISMHEYNEYVCVCVRNCALYFQNTFVSCGVLFLCSHLCSVVIFIDILDWHSLAICHHFLVPAFHQRVLFWEHYDMPTCQMVFFSLILLLLLLLTHTVISNNVNNNLLHCAAPRTNAT